MSSRLGQFWPVPARRRCGAYRGWLLSTLLFSTAVPALAVAKFSIGPPRFELKLSAGGETTLVLDVSNHSDERLSLKAYAADVDLDEDGNPAYPRGRRGARSCSDWFRFNPQSLRLEAQGGAEFVRATVRVPAEASGTYWCVLFLEDVPPAQRNAPKSGVGLRLNARLGSVVYADIGPRTAPGIRVEKFSAQPGSRPDSIEAVAEVVHVEGGYLRSTGRWELLGEGGQEISSSAVEFPVLPGHRRRVHWSVSAPAGRYHLRLSLDYGGSSRLTAETGVTVPGAGGGKR